MHQTAYDRRFSDCSSDVCSSDLFGHPVIAAKAVMQPAEAVAGQRVHDLVRILAMIFPGPGARPRPGIAQQQHATLSARGHDLVGAEGKGGGITKGPCHLSFPDRTIDRKSTRLNSSH